MSATAIRSPWSSWFSTRRRKSSCAARRWRRSPTRRWPTLDRAQSEVLLRRIWDERPAPDGARLWDGWQLAVAALQLESLRPLVEQGFATGRIDSWTDDEVTFEETLRRKPGDEEDILVAASFSPVSMSEDFVTGRVPYTPSGENGDDFEFAPASMSDEELLRMEHEALADDPFCDGGALDDRGIDDPPRPTPVVDPWRKVGRNDPCPCGSGKKFKKCCAA